MAFEFDYSKLRGKIIEKFQNLERFALAMALTATTLGRKLANKSAWTQDEIMRACSLLGIPPEDIYLYFFCSVG